MSEIYHIIKLPGTDLEIRYRSMLEMDYISFDCNRDLKWLLLQGGTYISPRYGKSITITGLYEDSLNPMLSDGASGAFDIVSASWWFHDKVCRTCRWDDGSPITNWQASRVLSDILWLEGRYIRSQRWKYATFFLGGKKIKSQVGWF